MSLFLPIALEDREQDETLSRDLAAVLATRTALVSEGGVSAATWCGVAACLREKSLATLRAAVRMANNLDGGLLSTFEPEHFLRLENARDFLALRPYFKEAATANCLPAVDIGKVNAGVELECTTGAKAGRTATKPISKAYAVRLMGHTTKNASQWIRRSVKAGRMREPKAGPNSKLWVFDIWDFPESAQKDLR